MVRFANIDDVHDELKSADLTDSFGHPKSFVLDLSSEEAYSKVLKQVSGHFSSLVEELMW